jgi:serine/threonine-protein kinase SRPK3
MLMVANESVLEGVESAEEGCQQHLHNLQFSYAWPSQGCFWAEPVLCDFGEARIGKHHKGLAQPELYRAPEVLFDMEWGSSVDIWSVAAMVSVLTP